MRWQKIKVKDFEVTYTDVMKPHSKSYGHPGKYICNEEEVSLQPESRQLTFIKVFGTSFFTAWAILGYLFTSPPEMWAIVIGGPLLGGLACTAIYFLAKLEIDAGPYIVFNRATDEIVLPRLKKTFPKDAVTLQWITGRCEHHPDIHTDLNLIVQEDGVLNRYFVMGAPLKKYIRSFVQEADIPVIEINTGWRGRRDLDAQSNPIAKG